MSHFEIVFGVLQRAGVRFLGLGWIAITAHGVNRYTDAHALVLAFYEDNLPRGVRALEKIGLKTKIPVTA